MENVPTFENLMLIFGKYGNILIISQFNLLRQNPNSLGILTKYVISTDISSTSSFDAFS